MERTKNEKTERKKREKAIPGQHCHRPTYKKAKEGGLTKAYQCETKIKKKQSKQSKKNEKKERDMKRKDTKEPVARFSSS